MKGLADCIVDRHDLRLVAGAVLVCVLTAAVTMTLYGRVRAGHSAFRPALVALMGTTAAIGTWTTHIVAMLAYETLLPVAYDAALTATSLALTLLVMGGGVAAGALARDAAGRMAAGGAAGIGIGTMHYTGMAAVSLPGHLDLDRAGVAASLALGMALSAAAMAVAGDGRRPARLVAAGAILCLAVAGLHFTGMAAATVVADPSVPFDGTGITTGLLSAMALAGTGTLLVVAATSLHIERRTATEGERRVRDLADAALEGIVFSRAGSVVDANAAFCSLVGLDVRALRGRPLVDMLPAGAGDRTTLDAGERGPIPVDVIARGSAGRSDGMEVHVVRDLRQQIEAERRIRFLAHHDALTGLANRVTFGDALAEAMSGSDAAPVSALCLDLDRFKWVNDTLGHAVGDALLQQVAGRLTAVAGPGATVARMGGDEFALLLRGGAEPAGRLAREIVDAIAMPYGIEGHDVVVGVSVGIAEAPRDASAGPELLNAADMALYRAKADGRGVFRHFEQGMDERMRRRRQLEADLRAALPRGELSMHYQPLVDVGTEDIVGFEALMRWESPTRGSVPPAEFIPLAEEIGLIVELGDWSVARACADAAPWEGAPMIAINLSPLHFRKGDVVAIVEAAIRSTGMDPARIELEITEGLLLCDGDDVLAKLRRLRDLGVRIAMDDFGTGYSSLGYLSRFPFDKIKIDRSFVRDMATNAESLAIVRAVTGLGASLGLPVVAEGVETEEQMGRLRREGCTEAQGYLFSRALPASEIPAMLLSPRAVAAAA